MTPLDKFLIAKSTNGLTAKIIAKRLNETQLLPKTARFYTDRLVYNVLHNLSYDENVLAEIEKEYLKTTLQNA